MRTHIAAACLITLLAAGCGEEQAPDQPRGTVELDQSLSIAILADEAMREIGSVSYSFSFYGEGFLATELLPVSGRADMDMGTEPGGYLFRVTLDTGDSLGITPVPSVYSEDGEYVYVRNDRDSLYARGLISEGGEDLLAFNSRMLMLEFVLDEPFSDEIHADSLIHLGTENVAGIECDAIQVDYAGTVSEAVWYLGTEDHLPRKVVRFYEYQGEQGSMILELSDIVPVDGFPEGHFILEPPEGYQVREYSAFLPLGSAAPEWVLSDPDGTSLSLGSLRGKIVVMDFWATWCGPCRQVMPALQALSLEYADAPLTVLGINVWENADPVAFMTENGYTYPILLSGDAVAEEYLVTGIPTFYVIDTEGSIAFAAKGASPENEENLRAAIEALLSE